MLEPVRRVAALFASGAGPPKEDLHRPEEPRLYRFGVKWESANDLARDAAAAEASGYPHGVSTFDRSNRVDAVSASRTELERHFSVIQTGRNRRHHTVALPKPIDDDVAELFNGLFGRVRE